MANALYDKGREGFADAGINLLTDTINVALVDSSVYTPNLATDQFWSTITGLTNAVVGTPVTLTSKATTAGVFDAADVTFSVVTGASAEYLVIYKSTGTDTTSPLIALIDTATGLPVTPNGGDIAVVWDNGVNKIFKL